MTTTIPAVATFPLHGGPEAGAVQPWTPGHYALLIAWLALMAYVLYRVGAFETILAETRTEESGDR